jgi:methionyl-tRNA formyltransferase
MGTPGFALASLEALLAAGSRPLAVFTQGDKPAGRGRKLSVPPVKELALKAGLPVFQPSSLKDPEVQERLSRLEPEVLVVVAYGKILPPPILEIPPLGCVNVHASVLPRHRGAAPIAYSIWEGDERAGVSTMRMDAGLDTGPVYLSDAIPMPPDATTASLTPELAVLGARLLLSTLEGLRAGILRSVPQNDALATLAPRLKPEQGRLDFREPAPRLERQVRAFAPWPGTFFEVGGGRIKVLSAVLGSGAPAGAVPGEVVPGPALGVACGDGQTLWLGQIQREGRRPLPSAEVLRGFPIPPGTRLQT